MDTNIEKLQQELAALRKKVNELTRKEAESRQQERFYHFRKMEAVGRLAGSVAHDFNNILMIVISFSDLILSELASDDPLRTELEEIKRAGERGADITRRLLTFSNKLPVHRQLVDPRVLIEELMFLVRELAGETIQIDLAIDKACGLVQIDSRQIEQAIINLIHNACEAMPQGGTLSIRLSREEFVGDTAVNRTYLPPGLYLVIEIRDTGCGMNEQVKANIFEPFFTTKTKSGAGLGLASAYGFVRQNNGIILFDTSPDLGSSFKIYLPSLDPPDEPEDTPPSPVSRPAVQTGTIMVVEDHDIVRKMIRQSLRTQGFEVLEATNAEEALAICRSCSRPIQLVISDIIMPGKTGLELAEELLDFWPAVKVLFISGYSGENDLASHVLPCQKHFLLKPFSAEALLKKVDEVLAT